MAKPITLTTVEPLTGMFLIVIGMILDCVIGNGSVREMPKEIRLVDRVLTLETLPPVMIK